jgi:hypothetical protein
VGYGFEAKLLQNSTAREERVRGLAGLFRRIWAQSQVGVEVPMTIYRGGERGRFLNGPSLH